MSEVATIDPKSDRNLPQSEQKPAKTPGVTGKVKAAIDAMVWRGLKRDQAAEVAGMKDNSLYVAFRRPEVKSYYLRELDVLRLSERARSVSRLTELRDQDDNKMVAFNAAKELAGCSADEQSSAQRQAMPGLVVVVNTIQRSAPTSQMPVITVNDE